jgi:tetratricopeptide (TPR) repeat protein
VEARASGEDAKRAADLEKQVAELEAAGKFAEAVQPAEALRALRQRVQGAGHWQAADAARQVETLRRVAGLPAGPQRRLAEVPGLATRAEDLHGRAKYAEADQAYRQALAIQEEVLGVKHRDTALSYSNLAYNLNSQGRPGDAERLFRKALAVREEVLGPRHPDTAASYNDLATSLLYQGKPAEGEPLQRKALAIQEEVLGPKHIDTAGSYNDLAFILKVLGRESEVEPLLRKALAVREELLGPKHPDTAGGYNNLAAVLNEQGRHVEAEPLLRRALAIQEELLGPKHPDTAVSYNNLAYNLYFQGRLAEADVLYLKALAIREEVLGSKHRNVAEIYNNLAYNRYTRGDFVEAEPLFRKAVAIREEALGPKHPLTARSYNHLAFNLNARGQYAEAEPLCRKALAVFEAVLGPQHPDSAQAYRNLAISLDARGQTAEAERLYRKAVAVQGEVLGPQHRDTAQSYHNLASNLDAQGKDAEAERSWRAAAAAFEAARLRLARTGFDRAAAARLQPHLGLALCLARQGKPADAWQAAEAGLGRGLLDDLTALPAGPDEQRRLRQRSARLAQLDDLLLPLLTAPQLEGARRQRRDELGRERQALLEEVAREAADRSRREVYALGPIQKQLAPDAALVFWLDGRAPPRAGDRSPWHWACVVRRAGPPAWVKLPGSGPGKAWTDDDDALPRRLRAALADPAAGWDSLARRLAAQRLAPLEPHLAADADLPAVRRLIAVPAGSMAGVPLEALTDQYAVSYAPSGTVFARLAEGHRPLRDPSLLALGDPAFATPDEKHPAPPGHGLLVLQVVPGGAAATAGLRADDVLLAYGGATLTALADLRPKAEGGPVAARLWRDGREREVRLASGPLGAVFHKDPGPVALRAREKFDALLAATRGPVPKPLPGTRREVAALAGLFPRGKAQVLLGSDASEQALDALAGDGRLHGYRVLHFATHGQMDADAAARSALLLAGDRLPDAAEQVKRGKKPYTGRLTVEAVRSWQLDADLVTLSACETGLGREGGGEGLLGFSQALFQAGAHSVVLSLWKVDDSATALLMTRFYEDLLGKREGLKGPLGRAEALREAQHWLRDLRRPEMEALAVQLTKGEFRGSIVKAKPQVAPEEKADRPYAHPHYWAAFILLGDPD